jgi:hypothetical protein
MSGPGHDEAREGHDHDVSGSDADTAPARDGTGTAKLRSMLVGGVPDPTAVAALLHSHRAEQAQMYSVLHASMGNSFVQSVIQLNPMAPPPMKAAPLPMASEEDLKAQADKLTVEQLLKTSTLDSVKDATTALNILLEVDEAHRGRVIDGIDDKAFDNLISRLNDSERERLAKLVAASKNPKRKLRMWSEQHVGRAESDLARKRGDIGAERPLIRARRR